MSIGPGSINKDDGSIFMAVSSHPVEILMPMFHDTWLFIIVSPIVTFLYLETKVRYEVSNRERNCMLQTEIPSGSSICAVMTAFPWKVIALIEVPKSKVASVLSNYQRQYKLPYKQLFKCNMLFRIVKLVNTPPDCFSIEIIHKNMNSCYLVSFCRGRKFTPVMNMLYPDAFNCSLGIPCIGMLVRETGLLLSNIKQYPQHITNPWPPTSFSKHCDQHIVSLVHQSSCKHCSSINYLIWSFACV